ncbi:GspH/FimT family pseudopilin [Piscinibacter sp. XHJ-5]|uniref:GspH/FimT family pseudopilin n=1 Tax=Piscinibacter sp. XHJ-5 TaxID=3037797 RepID=UPI0024536BA2|nr:GspH/FimT family pseudopilin [Piscinibacter sp. XHJ-5]
MLNPRRGHVGLTLIELMVVIALLAFLLMLGAPSFSTWIQNSRLRSSAESILAGLQQAKAEAVSRNARVRFQFTSTLDDTCALSTSSANWVVNLDPDSDPNAVVGSCGTAPDDAAAPRILHKRDGVNTPTGLVVATGGVSSVVFNGLGRITPVPAGNVSITLSNPTIGDCADAGGPVTCLRIVVSPAGQLRMCNPKFSLPDPQGC